MVDVKLGLCRGQRGILREVPHSQGINYRGSVMKEVIIGILIFITVNTAMAIGRDARMENLEARVAALEAKVGR